MYGKTAGEVFMEEFRNIVNKEKIKRKKQTEQDYLGHVSNVRQKVRKRVNSRCWN